MWFKCLILLINFLIFSDCTNITLRIENGLVKGKTIQVNNKTVNVFYGIRYGKAPIGNLRFKKPEKVENWTGVYDATTIPRKFSCWQAYTFIKQYANNVSVDQLTQFMTEDCLFLNVWTTTNLTNNNTNTKLKPVMVWIHGGALALGSSLQGSLLFDKKFYLTYDGTLLSTFDTVIVSMNYRLGPLGFIYAGNDQAPGNVGLYDQSLALQWVKNNIRAFGGDPNDVTIFGESAGSRSVSYHILSPISKNLFKKAILQSASEFDNVLSNDKSVALNISKQHALDKGCKNDVNWLGCIKKIDLKVLFNYTLHMTNITFSPVVGDDFYPIKAKDALKLGKFNSNIKILAGTTANEGDNLILLDSRRTVGEFEMVTSNFTNSKARKFLNSYLKEIKFRAIKSESQKNKVVNFYIGNKTDSNLLKSSIGHVIGDGAIVCPTFNFVKQIASWSSDNKVYFYKFNHKGHFPLSNPACNFSWSGVCHGADIPYVFGIPLYFPKISKEDTEFSYLIMKLWTNFAKYGNPLKGDANELKLKVPLKYKNITWPVFKKENNNIISQVMVLDPNNFGKILVQPYYDTCDVLWK